MRLCRKNLPGGDLTRRASQAQASQLAERAQSARWPWAYTDSAGLIRFGGDRADAVRELVEFYAEKWAVSDDAPAEADLTPQLFLVPGHPSANEFGSRRPFSWA